MLRDVKLYIEFLLQRAVKNGVLYPASPLDIIEARNKLLDILDLMSPLDCIPEKDDTLDTEACVEALCGYAASKGLIDDDTTSKDLFAARIMGALCPTSGVVAQRFYTLYADKGPQAATQWFYNYCIDSLYIRMERINKNIKWDYASRYGKLEITINLSKPEKDPKEIAKLKSAPASGYPKCMLCRENVGYAGRVNFPARQNHRMIPLRLAKEQWYLQYSPYVYYNEHCIVLNSVHKDMLIDRGAFERLFDFEELFPHYFIGSNADLSIVGGSILNHDHFQGGMHEMPMHRAKERFALRAPAEGVSACVLDWPMTTLRLRSKERASLIDCAMNVLGLWREYSDAQCDILAHSADGTAHNTITPILRFVNGVYELYIVLRNNRTTDEFPLGIFHPHNELHHIKKENIGLIEVMGLFILPARLKEELKEAEAYLCAQKGMDSLMSSDAMKPHMDWLTAFASRYALPLSEEAAHEAIQNEVGLVCEHVLEDAGVYKTDAKGNAGLMRFLYKAGYRRLQ